MGGPGGAWTQGNRSFLNPRPSQVAHRAIISRRFQFVISDWLIKLNDSVIAILAAEKNAELMVLLIVEHHK